LPQSRKWLAQNVRGEKGRAPSRMATSASTVRTVVWTSRVSFGFISRSCLRQTNSPVIARFQASPACFPAARTAWNAVAFVERQDGHRKFKKTSLRPDFGSWLAVITHDGQRISVTARNAKVALARDYKCKMRLRDCSNVNRSPTCSL